MNLQNLTPEQPHNPQTVDMGCLVGGTGILLTEVVVLVGDIQMHPAGHATLILGGLGLMFLGFNSRG